MLVIGYWLFQISLARISGFCPNVQAGSPPSQNYFWQSAKTRRTVGQEDA